MRFFYYIEVVRKQVRYGSNFLYAYDAPYSVILLLKRNH